MALAIQMARRLWTSREVERVPVSADSLSLTFDLMEEYGLGRRRILDIALAANLKVAGIRRLATWNGADFRLFDFLEVVEPA